MDRFRRDGNGLRMRSCLVCAAVATLAILLMASCETTGRDSEVQTKPAEPAPATQPSESQEPAEPASPAAQPAPTAPSSPGPVERPSGNGASDRAITEQVRQRLAGDQWLSSFAHQIEISTTDGLVTLRGVVAGEDERRAVVGMATGVPGVEEVNDQLEVREGHVPEH